MGIMVPQTKVQSVDPSLLKETPTIETSSLILNCHTMGSTSLPLLHQALNGFIFISLVIGVLFS